MSHHLPYDRAERVAERVRELVALAFVHDLVDPRLKNVSITRIRMTRDLRIARLYYAIFDGSDEKKAEADRGLKSAAKFLKQQIAKELKLKFAPEIEIFYDEDIDREERVAKLLGGGDTVAS